MTDKKSGKLVHFPKLTEEEKEFINSIYKFAELTKEQEHVLRTLELTYGIVLIAYKKE